MVCLLLLLLCLVSLLVLLLYPSVRPVALPLLLSVLLVPLCTVRSNAATRSNATRLTEDLGIMSGLEEDEYGDMDIEDFTALDMLELLFSYVSGPGVSTASGSNAQPNAPAHIYVLEDAEALDEGGNPVPLAVSDTSPVVNAVRYSVRINGTAYTLLLPSDTVDKVFIDENGYLWNVSTSSISGRLFTGSFNPTATTGTLLYLNPCLGNNFSANRYYGSPNYMRRYYWSGNSLTYSDTYCTVLVEESGYPFYQSQTLVYIIIVLLGGVLLCLWKKSLR